jgi:hypothetical protein
MHLLRKRRVVAAAVALVLVAGHLAAGAWISARARLPLALAAALLAIVALAHLVRSPLGRPSRRR